MRIEIVMAVVATLVLLSVSAEAGPFRRPVTRTTATACAGGSCSSVRTVARGGGAQAHAEAMASTGVMAHASNHGATYEGVGVGSTPGAALSACCNNGGEIVDQGVSQSRDGRWFACRRYSLR